MILIEEIEQEQEEFREQGLLWSLNSVYHGCPIRGQLPLSPLTLATNESHTLNDFIEFLFEHSEHCDHISQKDAWKEFFIYQANN